ncbi:hypothetical protein Rruber_05486 (plasmid) [Rhodococcus ruber]|uniref:hypothetical protein n=1 Tax=Rhodococcus ruber TaxID=1830 RepID=UPI00315D8560
MGDHSESAPTGCLELLESDKPMQWLAARGEHSAATGHALIAVQRRREEALADEELGPMMASKGMHHWVRSVIGADSEVERL